ncbi:chromosome condensin MukBEF kleisin-like subunit [Escherichia coli]|nr:chromosome condensin MukBEF kleisin-like subunit [Escherichia coli]
MVRQRLLNRFTSEQAEGNAIYRLTPLGIGITDYYIRQREFSTLRLSMPVSYTLLRSHEPEADFVCRLQLEKTTNEQCSTRDNE